MPIDLEDYTGLIVQLSLRYYKKVPPNCQRFIDPDDFISMGKLRAWQVQSRWSESRKLRFTTFLHTCLENYFRDELEKLSAQKRACLGEIVDPAEVPLPFKAWFGPFDAERRVNKFLLLASPGLKEILNKFLFLGDGENMTNRMFRVLLAPYQDELTFLRKVTRASASDFRMILDGRPT